MSQAQLAIDNALGNPAIVKHLSDFGYSIQRIQQGKTLYNLAVAAQLAQSAEAGE